MPASSSTDQLLNRLQPLLDVALYAGGDVIEEIGSELTEKTAGGITSLALRSGGAVYRAIKNRYLKSQAKSTLDKALESANGLSDREAAYREFLDSDPTLKDSFAALLERREYLWALQAYCEDLPISDLVPGNFRLSEVFVPPSLVSAKNGVESRSIGPGELKTKLIAAGNSVVLGEAGSGKSSLARWLASRLVDDLLSDQDAMSLDELRLPVYVAATNLQQTNWATALRNAIDQQLGIRGLSELSGSFFDTHSPQGHSKWIVLIDGFDEVRDESKRNSLFRAIADIAKQDPDAFQFLTFVRGGSGELPLEDFACWNLLPERNIGSLVDRYLDERPQKDTLKTLLSEPDYAEVARAPLFVAMSAALISDDGEVPERPFELVEAFLAYGVEKSVPGDVSKQKALIELLTANALSPDIRIEQLTKKNPDQVSSLTSANARLQSRRAIAELMQNTGLVKLSANGSLQFIHKTIQQHLIAREFSSKVEPSSVVWSEIDPVGLGWASVEQLCIGWIENGKVAAPAIQALADFGPPGVVVMLRLAIQLVEVPDEVFERAFSSVFREVEEGITTPTDQILSRLALTRPTVRRRLLTLAKSGFYIFAVEPAARALAAAGYYPDIRARLVEFVQEIDGDPHTQCEVASILQENGDEQLALDVFLRESTKAGEDWVRLDAACRYYRATRSKEARERLRQLINRDYVEGNAKPSTWLIQEVLDLGETELALPLLSEAASFPSTEQAYPFSLQFERSVRAATALAKHDPGNGVPALERLLLTPDLSLRQKAEVIASIDEFDSARAKEANLSTLASRSPNQLDWFVIEILIRLGNLDEAWMAVRELVDAQVKYADLTHSATQCLERVLPYVQENEAESYLAQKVRRFSNPRLASMFSIIGRSDLAREHLRTFLTDVDSEKGIESASLLSTCGARSEGQAWLTNTSRNSKLHADHRISAAQTLSKVASNNLAMVALRKLARNSALSMEARCKAAEAFSYISNGNDYTVVAILVACAGKSSLSIRDRLTALLSALRIDPDAYAFDRDPEWLFYDIVEDNNVEESDLSAICKAASKLRIPLAELRPAAELLSAQDMATSVKLTALFCSKADDVFVRTALAELAERTDTTIAEVEAIISHFYDDEIPPSIIARADKIIADPSSPPGWRLRLAKCIGQCLGKEHEYYALPLVYRDSGLDLSTRIAAFSDCNRADPATFFADLTKVGELTVAEHLTIGDAALERDLYEHAVSALEEAVKVSPKSTYELVSVFQLAEKLAHPSTTTVQDEIIGIPLIIMLEEIDSDCVLRAIEIGGRKDREWAKERLSSLIESENTGAWQIPELADQLASFVDRETVLGLVRPMLDRILIELKKKPAGSYHFPTALRPFYERRWLTDAALLLDFVRDTNQRLSERIATIVLIKTEQLASNESVSTLLSSLVSGDITSPDDALWACYELERSGLRSEALFLADRIRAISGLKARQLLTLANVYSDLGQTFMATKVCSSVCLDGLKVEWLSDWDKNRLREMFGEREVTEFLRNQHQAPEDLIDRLQVARELVDEYGDPKALALIHDTAREEGLVGDDRFEAIDILNEFGYRQLAREIFGKIDLDTCDPLFAGAQALRLGLKAQALRLLRKSIANCNQTNRDWLRSNLAELMAYNELRQVNDI